MWVLLRARRMLGLCSNIQVHTLLALRRWLLSLYRNNLFILFLPVSSWTRTRPCGRNFVYKRIDGFHSSSKMHSIQGPSTLHAHGCELLRCKNCENVIVFFWSGRDHYMGWWDEDGILHQAVCYDYVMCKGHRVGEGNYGHSGGLVMTKKWHF